MYLRIRGKKVGDDRKKSGIKIKQFGSAIRLNSTKLNQDEMK